MKLRYRGPFFLAVATMATSALAASDTRPALRCSLALASDLKARENGQATTASFKLLGIAFELKNETYNDVQSSEVFDPNGIMSGFNIVELSVRPKYKEMRVIATKEDGRDILFLRLVSPETEKLFRATLLYQGDDNRISIERSMAGLCEMFRGQADGLSALDHIKKLPPTTSQ